MKQKKLLFILSLLALNAASLVSCGGNTSGLASNSTNQSSQSTSLVSLSITPNLPTSTSTSSSTPTPVVPDNQVKNYILFAHKEGITRFEAEEVDVSKYVISSDNPTKVIERPDASNGKFLAASTGDTAKNSTFEFSVSLDFDATISMTASYAQSNKWKNYSQDLTKSYTYIVDENRNMMLSSEKTVLSSRTDITNWEQFNYTPITLNKGMHTFSVKVAENTGKGNPNIDYFDFKITKVSGGIVDDKVPENDFHSSIQYQYINDSDYENVSKYANGVTELSKPRGIVIDFKDENISNNSFVLEYADNEHFDNSVIINNITSKKYAIQNLKLGQDLYWRVTDSQSNLSKAKTQHLQVADKGPRNIAIDGVSNVRDIGGYKSSLVSNGKIKQGLYYRGANLNSISEDGKKEMLRLGIKREIDMRDSYQCLGPYVDGIEYSAISIPSGTESKRFEEFKDEYKQIFTIIANANKEPIYLHCTAGADRTGIATFMLLTLCGVSYEDTARDYLFTNFSTQGTRVPNYTSEFKAWWSKLDNFEGNTKADKAKSWLISKGITAEQVEKIRSIFVENYK